VKDLAVSEMERSFTTFRMTKNIIHSHDKWGFWNYAKLSNTFLINDDGFYLITSLFEFCQDLVTV
jgi:hypothetical protein